MPRSSHRSEYLILAALAVLTGAVLLALTWKGIVGEAPSGRGVRTTRSANVEGTLVCYTLLERLGAPVARSDRMLVGDRLDDMGVIVLIDPVVHPHAGELVELRQWVLRGGVLITTEVLDDLAPLLDGVFVRNRRTDDPERSGGRTDRGPSHLALARAVTAAQFDTRDTLHWRGKEPNGSSTVVEPLYADQVGVRIGEHRLGRGRLILLADSSFLANGLIARSDNDVLAVNLASYALANANHPRIVFDEYHFGAGSYGQGLRVLARMLFTRSPGWAVLALTVAGVLFLIYQGRQFGPRRDVAQARRRSKMEYVYAVGASYRAAGAHRLTLRLLTNWFHQRVASQTGVAAPASNRRVAEELARRGPRDADAYERVLDGCDRVLAQPNVTQRQLITVVQQLARVEKEALNGHRGGK